MTRDPHSLNKVGMRAPSGSGCLLLFFLHFSIFFFAADVGRDTSTPWEGGAYFFLVFGDVDWKTELAAIRFSMYWPKT